MILDTNFTVENLNWIAGFFEGEGTVLISKPGKNHLGSLRVSIVNTDKEIIEFFKTFFGFGYIKQIKVEGNRKIAWRWVITAKQALNFLQIISPYIKRKLVKERFKTGIQYQKDKKHYFGGPGNFADENYRRQQYEYWLYMKELNFRGIDCPVAHKYKKVTRKKK